ncbi:MAG TPA: helix-turn-helix transcriptional regulator [Candidatus Micrarchaeaceae archaeon]|nr:helix-turn-helix transcriptional regulator [Candidatus Micrarchaeaceae archaeon]
MSKRKTWGELRRRRLEEPAARVGYQQAQLAYELGRQVRELREANGLSQRELAERMHTTQSVIARLEAGGSKPSLSTLERVAMALGTSVDIRFRTALAG